MKKNKSIIVLAILAVIVIFFGVITIASFEVGIYDYKSIASRIKLGLDVKGGVYAVYNVAPIEEGGSVTDADVASTISRLQTLLANKGYTEANVYEESYAGDRCIRVEVADVDDPETLFSLIGKPAELYFIPMSSSDVSAVQNGTYTLDKTKALVSSTDVASAFVSMNEKNQYVIALEFTADGTKNFANATETSKGSSYGYLSIWLDGKCIMTPSVTETIANGKAVISSSSGYSYEEAYEYALKIQSGTFSVKLSTRSKDTISAILGDTALETAIIAGVIGLVLIFVFMALVYGMLGIAADIALFIYVLLYMLALAIFPFVQLTLPGIAGIILSIGMAVDANIVTFERIKDDYQTHPSRPLRSAIAIGYSKSFWAIFDSNVTTVIGAIVLWVLGTGTITGFAVTLLLGIILSFFTAVFVTRKILELLLPLNDNLKAYRLVAKENVKEEQVNG